MAPEPHTSPQGMNTGVQDTCEHAPINTCKHTLCQCWDCLLGAATIRLEWYAFMWVCMSLCSERKCEGLSPCSDVSGGGYVGVSLMNPPGRRVFHWRLLISTDTTEPPLSTAWSPIVTHQSQSRGDAPSPLPPRIHTLYPGSRPLSWFSSPRRAPEPKQVVHRVNRPPGGNCSSGPVVTPQLSDNTQAPSPLLLCWWQPLAALSTLFGIELCFNECWVSTSIYDTIIHMHELSIDKGSMQI